MVLTAGCLFFFTTCGLDNYYYMYAPVRTYNDPTYISEYDKSYFEFSTNETGMREYVNSDAEFAFLGTAVYYKIYNNYSTMNSHVASVSSLSTSTNESAAATRVIETYKYQQLGTSNGTITPLVPATGSDQRVYIRLSNYQETISPNFAARITIDGVPADGSLRPRRAGNQNKLTFDFGRTDDDEDNAVPEEGDEDVEYGTFSDSEDKAKWYINMYAVAVGRDTTYTTYYSNVLWLGNVTISSKLDDN
ncbi:MAG: hypothetical protein K2H09_00505 [Treponemataceae bacterium]|nr:hypothetical protein [Treponemataceae bacterium]